MESILLISFLLTNALWLFHEYKREKLAKDERRELWNRIAEPSMIIPDEKIVKHRIDEAKINQKTQDELTKEFNEMTEMTEKERNEYAAVGSIDPELMRRDNS